MKGKLSIVILLLAFNSCLFADDLRGDTIDIHSYLMRLDFSVFTNHILTGDVTIGVKAKMNNVQAIHLDLLNLTVDSVKVNSTIQVFTYNDSILNINFPSALNTGDSATLEIFYHGHPLQPSNDFGGFFWNGTMAYNIGVSFVSTPNNFGKVWFPCFDNFKVRSYYEYYVTTRNIHKAFCNGVLLDTVQNATINIWHWKLYESIPSYLASVAVAKFTTLTDTVNGMNGTIPVELGAVAADTTMLKSQFVHLHEVFHNEEKLWGRYRWERVGYCIVPFAYGAMEHATNIIFSEYYLNPNVPTFFNTCESTMAHELSHHWFGDLVTCDSSEEMWLNEGWASYNEITFYEYTYGIDSAKQQMRIKLQNVLQMGNINDQGYYPVGNIPHDMTYGTTVYDKGANVIHTLRYYMGDSLFFHCVKNYIDYYAYKNGSTEKLRDFLSQCSGIDLTNYFNDWVLQPGFTHLSIEHSEVEPVSANYLVNYQIRQRISHAQHYYNNVPVKISFFNQDMSRVTETVMVSGECTSRTTTLPFRPVYIVPDFDEDLQDAINDEWKIIKDTGNYNYGFGLMNVKVNSMGTDSVLLRVEHNWIAADAMFNPIHGLHLNNHRYWTVNGIFDSTFNATATINYNGTTGAYLDSTFISNKEDSLVLMYRPTQHDDWAFADSFLVNTEYNDSDRVGTITIYNIQKGEYALAIYNSNLRTDTNTRVSCPLQTGIQQINPLQNIKLYPNPTAETLTVSFEINTFNQAEIFDILGKKFFTCKISNTQNSISLNLKNIAAGSYFVKLTDKSGNGVTKKLIKE